MKIKYQDLRLKPFGKTMVRYSSYYAIGNMLLYFLL